MSTEKTYKIIVSYDGTDFSGWQIQPERSTISASLEASWYRLFKSPITILGASRTDSGVHALGQVARFYGKLPTSCSLSQAQKAWNACLPPSVYIRELTELNYRFNPCVGVREKTYYYTLFLKQPLPFVARFGWYYPFIHMVDLNKFYQALTLYQGTHDFGSFCRIENDQISSIRTIHSITIKKILRWNALIISVKGPGFVHFQIRRMIGYALDIARRQDLDLNYLKELLRNPDPRQTLLKAEAKGLCLRKIIYD